MADQATPPDESEVNSEPETIEHETLSDDPVDIEPVSYTHLTLPTKRIV